MRHEPSSIPQNHRYTEKVTKYAKVRQASWFEQEDAELRGQARLRFAPGMGY